MREYFDIKDMSLEDFRSLQLKELDILLHLDRVCKKHGLRYFLAGGTLIGAIRHKGFIPWDDDIDVHMPRPDYERLFEIWNNDKYILCKTDLIHNMRHHAGSIVDRKSTFIERRNKNDDIPQGIKIDVIPIDAVPKSWIGEQIQLFWAIIYAIYNVQRLPENQGGKLMSLFIKFLLWIVPSAKYRYKIWNFAEKQMSKYDFETHHWVKELVAPLRSMRHKYSRQRFEDTVYFEFEGHLLPSHGCYKEYLTNGFGNYMELPPSDSRIPKSDVVYMNFDEPYIKYKGKYYCANNTKISY